MSAVLCLYVVGMAALFVIGCLLDKGGDSGG